MVCTTWIVVFRVSRSAVCSISRRSLSLNVLSILVAFHTLLVQLALPASVELMRQRVQQVAEMQCQLLTTIKFQKLEKAKERQKCKGFSNFPFCVICLTGCEPRQPGLKLIYSCGQEQCKVCFLQRAPDPYSHIDTYSPLALTHTSQGSSRLKRD